MVDKVYETDNYIVVETDDAMGEDGKYGRKGYAVVNKSNSMVEHTTMILPQAIYQAQGFSDGLEQLMAEPADPTDLAAMPIEDVSPN